MLICSPVVPLCASPPRPPAPAQDSDAKAKKKELKKLKKQQKKELKKQKKKELKKLAKTKRKDPSEEPALKRLKVAKSSAPATPAKKKAAPKRTPSTPKPKVTGSRARKAKVVSSIKRMPEPRPLPEKKHSKNQLIESILVRWQYAGLVWPPPDLKPVADPDFTELTGLPGVWVGIKVMAAGTCGHGSWPTARPDCGRGATGV